MRSFPSSFPPSVSLTTNVLLEDVDPAAIDKLPLSSEAREAFLVAVGHRGSSRLQTDAVERFALLLARENAPKESLEKGDVGAAMDAVRGGMLKEILAILDVKDPQRGIGARFVRVMLSSAFDPERVAVSTVHGERIESIGYRLRRSLGSAGGKAVPASASPGTSSLPENVTV